MASFRLICVALLVATCVVVADGPHYGAWSEPANMGPTVNWLHKTDYHPHISRNSLSLYFSSGRGKTMEIYVSHRASVDEPWGDPYRLGPAVNGDEFDLAYRGAPVLSRDGHWLYFSCERPGGMGAADIYVSHRKNNRDDDGWEEAQPLPGSVNTSAAEQPGSLFEDEMTGTLSLYLTRGGDIYVTRMLPDETFDTPEAVVELNGTSIDRFPTIRRDGLEIVFTSNRPGSVPDPVTSAPSLDLWFSTRSRVNEPWSTPEPVPGVNSSATENSASLSFDGSELIFSSTRVAAALQDLFVATRSRQKGRPE
jgi:hypothetical protein